MRIFNVSSFCDAFTGGMTLGYMGSPLRSTECLVLTPRFVLASTPAARLLHTIDATPKQRWFQFR